MSSPFISFADAARESGYSDRQFRREAVEAGLKIVKFGPKKRPHYRLLLSEFEAWKRTHKPQPARPYRRTARVGCL